MKFDPQTPEDREAIRSVIEAATRLARRLAKEKEMNHERCRSCEAPIFWILTSNGKKTPIDVATSVEGKGWQETPEGWRIVHGSPGTPVHWSHFSTCPQRQKWSRKGTPSEK